MPMAALLPHMLSPTPEHLKTFFGTAEDVVVYATGYETGFDDIRTVKDDEEARTNGIPTDGSMLQVPDSGCFLLSFIFSWMLQFS